MQSSKGIKRKPLIGIIVIMSLAVLGAALFMSFGSTAENPKPVKPLIRPVKTMILAKTALIETRSFPGVVRTEAETELSFRVDGPLIEYDIRIGRRVEKGDVIARIDPRDFEIRVMRLEAALAEARANLKAMKVGARAEDIAVLESKLVAAHSKLNEAKKDFDRHKSLLDRHVISRSKYDQAEVAYDAARTNVEALNQELKKARSGSRIEDIEAAEAGIETLTADLNAAKNALKDTRLFAPFNGFINQKFVENYESVKNGDPIVSLLDFSSVEVRTAIPEDLVVRRDAFSSVYCTLDAYPGRRIEATLKEVGLKTDSANQSFPMTVTLRIPEDIVVGPGMAATVNIVLDNPEKPSAWIFLPTDAVFADPQGQSCVWKIDPKAMRVVRTPVTIGDLNGDNIQVLSGLSPGERIVTAGARFLRDNQQVRILEKRSEAGS